MTARREPDPTRRSSRAQAAILEAGIRELIGEIGWDEICHRGNCRSCRRGQADDLSVVAFQGGACLGYVVRRRCSSSCVFPTPEIWQPTCKAQIKSVIDLSNDPTFGPSFRALVAESQHDTALSNQLLERIFRPRIEAARERLRAAQQDGQLAPDIDLDLAIDLFYGGFYHRYLLRVAPLTHDRAGCRC